jgi:hypothetical protein|tara:strand:- start:2023 stop:2238 length:216 start_codon:yes stop_codon:yes gene_type:complete
MRPFDHAWRLLKGYAPIAHGTGTLMPQEGDDDFGQPHDPYGTGEDMFDTPEMRRRIAEYFAQNPVEKPVLM